MRLRGNLLEDFGKSFSSLIKEEAAQERRLFGPIPFLLLGMLKGKLVILGATAACLTPERRLANTPKIQHREIRRSRVLSGIVEPLK